MCFFSAPQAPAAPAAIPEKQPQRSPTVNAGATAQQELMRRLGMAATILTPNNMGAPSTTNTSLTSSTPGKTTLGS